MKANQFSTFIMLLVSIHCLAFLGAAQDFDFFYFVQQWPGSYCDTRHSCCYPSAGKPEADFGIHGLWPNYNDGTYPSNCNPDKEFDESKIEDLIDSLDKNWPTLSCPTNDGVRFWSHEWMKHGTCTKLDEHDYFVTALKLKEKVNLLQILENAGVKPDDEFYQLDSIVEAIEQATGFTPGIECNVDKSKNHQLYQVYVCVDTSGSELIKCPVQPHGRCTSRVQFPRF